MEGQGANGRQGPSVFVPRIASGAHGAREHGRAVCTQPRRAPTKPLSCQRQWLPRADDAQLRARLGRPARLAAAGRTCFSGLLRTRRMSSNDRSAVAARSSSSACSSSDIGGAIFTTRSWTGKRPTMRGKEPW